MKYVIVISNHFHNILMNYINLIAKYSLLSAKKYYNLLNKEFYSLEILPKRYHHIKNGNYYFIVKNYRIYYRVDDENNLVILLNMIDTRQDDKNIG